MKKILVIEDELEIRRNITALLRYKKYEPVAVENGRLGVELARREKPDLILCNVMMPELDGVGRLRRAARVASGCQTGSNSVHFSYRLKAKKMTFAAA